MTIKSLLVGAVALGAISGLAACGGSSGAATPTPSTGGLTLPNIPGLGNSSGGSAPAANTLLTASDVQSISGDFERHGAVGRLLGHHLHLFGHER